MGVFESIFCCLFNCLFDSPAIRREERRLRDIEIEYQRRREFRRQLGKHEVLLYITKSSDGMLLEKRVKMKKEGYGAPNPRKLNIIKYKINLKTIREEREVSWAPEDELVQIHECIPDEEEEEESCCCCFC